MEPRPPNNKTPIARRQKAAFPQVKPQSKAIPEKDHIKTTPKSKSVKNRPTTSKWIENLSLNPETTTLPTLRKAPNKQTDRAVSSCPMFNIKTPTVTTFPRRN